MKAIDLLNQKYKCMQCKCVLERFDPIDDEGRCEDCARGELVDKQETLQQLIIDRAPTKEIAELNFSVLCYMQYLEEEFGKEEE